MDRFAYDVILSYGNVDESAALEIGARLREDGLRVSMQDDFEQARVLVLVISRDVSSAEWLRMEGISFPFRDPANKRRRFIPVRLDDTPVRSSIAQFQHIEWHGNRRQEYAKLLSACERPVERVNDSHAPVKVFQLDSHYAAASYAFRPDWSEALCGGHKGELKLWELRSGQMLRSFDGHTKFIDHVAWSSDERLALSGSDDHTARLWEVTTGRCIHVLEGHTDRVRGVAFSKDLRCGLTASMDSTVKVWDLETGKCIRTLKGNAPVWTVAWSPNGRQVLSGGGDGALLLWDLEAGQYVRLGSHAGRVRTVAWRHGHALSAGSDKGIRLWDVGTRRCLRVLEGHMDSVWRLGWSDDQRLVLSGSLDTTVRLWDIETGQCLHVARGHESSVASVSLSPDGCHALSGDMGGSIREWDFTQFVKPGRASPMSVPAQVQYTNAKVLIVGDSGVGKSGLSNYLAHNIKVEDEKPLPSTDGAWATHWPLPHEEAGAVEREIWVWDFAGQVDYRLVHQLYMEDAAAVLLVFNPQNENPFEGLGQWDRDLQKAVRKPLAKLLAAARVDRGGLVVSAASMARFMSERGFLEPLHLTSAKTGDGCEALRAALVKAIDWQGIPDTTSPVLYHRLKQEILNLRDSGLVLIRLAELKQRMEMTLRAEPFTPEELDTVVSLMAGPGMIQRLEFGGFILLRPEILSRYAAAVVRKVRKHPRELGCIGEDEMLAGDLDFQDFRRLENKEDEAVVLRTLLDTFVGRAWCLRQSADGRTLLTFPSYFRRERKEQPSHPSVLVTYRFAGPVDDIYATLVVRLHHTKAFDSTDLWKSAADFRTQTGAALGFTLVRETEGTSRLEVYFEPGVDPNSRVLFLRYVHDHLAQHAQSVVRLRHYSCGDRNCDAYGQAFAIQAKIDQALAPGGKGKVFCPDCGQPILLRDVIEEKFNSDAVRESVREMQRESQMVIDNESRELMAVHHTGFIVAEAGQIYRGYTNSDHGVDGEIEFKDDQGRASGKRLYVQLKSGDSYLKKRQSDDAEIFQIKNPRWADYWQRHAYTVMLVVRTSDGEIRWMDVSSYLRRESAGGKTIKQIVFEGERLDVMSVRRWRDASLQTLPGVPTQ